jgi:hypothetical protein
VLHVLYAVSSRIQPYAYLSEWVALLCEVNPARAEIPTHASSTPFTLAQPQPRDGFLLLGTASAGPL